VIYNRLAAGQRLELDSTVNYPLDLQALRTTPEDRARVGPYNSYAVAGLPPTPIAAPRVSSLAAVAAPTDGDGFIFFVAGCPGGTRDGSHYFSRTLDEHNANIARANEECAGQ
ncbi:MAG: endolytic transglycosylase MltG, partial [Candidatus Limnocylindria bacterium]